MATRVFKTPHSRVHTDREEAPADLPTSKVSEARAQLDSLLDEIDEVLEENAEEFVRGYVQKGGE